MLDWIESIHIYCISVYCSLLILWTCVWTLLPNSVSWSQGMRQQQLKVQWFFWPGTHQEPRTTWYDDMQHYHTLSTPFSTSYEVGHGKRKAVVDSYGMPQQDWAEPLRVATLGYIGYIACKPIHLQDPARFSFQQEFLQMAGSKTNMAVCQNLVPLVNIKIAGKWMFIPLKMVFS